VRSNPQQGPLRFDFIHNRPLRELVVHWASLLDGARPGERRAFDPVECKSALPHVWLCQREPSGRYRIRLTGEGINILFGPRLRGRYIDEVLVEDELARLRPRLEAVLDTPGFHWCEGPLFEVDPAGTRGESVMMPLLERGKRCIVLGGTVHGWRVRREPPRFHPPDPKAQLFIPLDELAEEGLVAPRAARG
jgi:hypothetical protein